MDMDCVDLKENWGMSAKTTMNIRNLIYKFTHRPIRSSDEFWRKHAMIGLVNEFVGRQVISSNDREFSLPFLCNPFRSGKEKEAWQKFEHLQYEYLNEKDRQEADRRFQSFWPMMKDRIKKDWVIFDVGCNSGYFLHKFHELGFTRNVGIDPQKLAIDYAREHRPHLDIREGFFGPPENDVQCDILVMFKSIFRIPYSSNLFDAIDRCAGKFVFLEGVAEMQDFCRDVHFELSKKGFMCIEKQVFSSDFIPIGYPGADDPEVLIDPASDRPLPHKNFYSNFAFRRIEPRE
jgi:SAM-dependent methyltransferase